MTEAAALRWRAWRLVRPLVRPIAWRLRTFFVGPLHDEIRELRAQVDVLRAELHARADRDADALEQALLTLALDHESRRLPQSGKPLP